MKFSDFADIKIIDCHLHLWMLRQTETEENLRKQGESLVEVVNQPKSSNWIYASSGYGGLYLKLRYPDLFFAGGPVPGRGRSVIGKVNWEEHINRLVEVGFDGIGEMGSKPRPKAERTPLDSANYERFWRTCEYLNFTVLCHVADPEEFWDEKSVPDWARDRGWGYYEGDFPTKEELYREMGNILDRHPDLKVVLCHFYFMSADLERASGFLDNYPNAHFDLSLGVELMYNMSRRRDDWRDFFNKYDDRILFGTDIGVSKTLQQHLDRIWLIRNFLESDEEFYTPTTADQLLTRYTEPYMGLKLPQAALEKMYAKNFQRLWAAKPREVDIELAISQCEKEGRKAVAKSLEKLSLE